MSYAQGEYPIAKINFSGQQRTAESYMKLFLKTEIDDLVTEASLQQDMQRLKNLVSINDATFTLDTTADKLLILNITVAEARTFLPIVNFGGIKGNFWYQIGFTDINQGGKGRQLLAYYQNNDGRHNGEVFFKNQFVNGSMSGYSIGLLRYASIEPLYFQEFDNEVLYRYDIHSASGSLIKNLDYTRYAEFGLAAFQESYQKEFRSPDIMTPGPESLTEFKLLGKARFQQNKLNYHYYLLSRHDWWAQYQTVFNTSDKLWFHTFTTTYRRFWQFGESGNLALRFRFGISTNRNTPFAPFVADSFTNLRGLGNRIDRGTAQIIWNVEYRHSIYDRNNWAGQIVAFTDLGTWRNPGGQFSQVLDQDQFRQFVGGGIRIIYKKIYGAILRIDFGVNIYNTEERGLVVGFGQYF